MNIDLLQKIDRIHPYPAKFTIELALKYIAQYTKEGDTIYDPFVGSGTSLLAASELHRIGYGTDINHIAILISKGKLLHLSDKDFDELYRYIDEFEKEYEEKCNSVTPFYYKSIDHWFCQNSIVVLSYILEKNKSLLSDQQRTFVELALSSIINVVSNQESDTRYAAIEKPDLTVDKVAAIFIKKFRYQLSLFESLNNEDRWEDKCLPVLLDSKNCETIVSSESVDLIITSPPYVNTYDYYLYHKHRMNWLGYDVKYSMDAEIGSRREFSSLKHNEGKFSEDLLDVFQSCNHVLKKNGVVVLVIGDGKVSGKIYDAKEHMLEMCIPLKWKMIDYSYTNLDETSRSFQKSYRTKGKKEHIMVFRKEG